MNQQQLGMFEPDLGALIEAVWRHNGEAWVAPTGTPFPAPEQEPAAPWVLIGREVQPGVYAREIPAGEMIEYHERNTTTYQPSATSLLALRTGDRTEQANSVERFIDAAGPRGATTAEAVAGTGMPHQTVSARITELKKQGRVLPSGYQRRSPRGVLGNAWVTPRNLPGRR